MISKQKQESVQQFQIEKIVLQKRKVSEQVDIKMETCFLKLNEKQIYYKIYEPTYSIAQIVFLPGLHSHSDQYHDIAKYFANNKITFQIFDFTNFGQSKKEDSQENLKSIYKDLQIVLEHAEIDLPLFLMGHGYSASLILDLASKNKDLNLAGIIPVCPVINSQENNFFLDSFLRKINFQSISVLNNQLDCTALIQNNHQIPHILEDKNAQNTIKYKLFSQLNKMTQNLSIDISQPIFLIGTKQDQFAKFKKILNFFNNLKLKKKEVSILNQGQKNLINRFHDILKKDENFEIKPLLLQWIKSQNQYVYNFRSINFNNLLIQLDSKDQQIKLNYKHKSGIILQTLKYNYQILNQFQDILCTFCQTFQDFFSSKDQ